MGLTYDNESRLAQMQYSFANRNLVYQSVYGEGDRLESFTLVDAWEKVLQYDCLQRLSSSTLKNASGSTVSQTTYGYFSPEPGRTTLMVSSETNSAANTSLSYTYDNDGRVSMVYEDGDLVLRYTYDPSQGFLIREDNAYANETYLYTYDEMGNMLTKKTYGLDFSSNPFDLLESESFSYAQSSLGKRYGEWNSYDALGNLTFDDDKAWSYTWDGRQLVDITEDGGSPQFTFDYNADGIRTRKGITDYGDEWTYHSYTLDGTTIVKETIYFESYGMVVSSRDIYYYYDENGAPLGLNWNNTNYYYYKNIFGDVLGIMNSNGTMVVRYAYDAWGNPISTTGAMANTLGQDNPFRYRGYYYDTETGLYYLNARYYNPEWGRFLSPDPVLDTSSAVGCNLFTCCGNDPINRIDESGAFWDTFFDVISLVSSIVEVCQNPDDPWAWVGLAMDALDLIPIVSGLGEAARAIKTVDRIADTADDIHDASKAAGNAIEASTTVAKKGWNVGDDITNLTKAGNEPSWSTVRQRYWKNEAHYNPGKYGPDNLDRMKKGLAPIGTDNFSMELHHPNGRNGDFFYQFIPVTRTEHMIIHYGG